MHQVYTLYIQEEAYMEYRQIDCKFKEIYYNAKPIVEEDEIEESAHKFWNSLRSIAVNNMAIQQIRMA